MPEIRQSKPLSLFSWKTDPYLYLSGKGYALDATVASHFDKTDSRTRAPIFSDHSFCYMPSGTERWSREGEREVNQTKLAAAATVGAGEKAEIIADCHCSVLPSLSLILAPAYYK
jgi:hypothetical protein